MLRWPHRALSGKLSSQLAEPGIVDQIAVKEGERVTENQLLAKLDTEVLECTLEIARQRSRSLSALQAAEAEHGLRQKFLEQLSQLHDRGHSTQREIDRAEADLKVAEARVAMAKEEVELQHLECRRIEAQIERRTIRSPLNGVVSEVLRSGASRLLSDCESSRSSNWIDSVPSFPWILRRQTHLPPARVWTWSLWSHANP